MAHRIVTLPGDGIGPEIMAPTLELLGRLGDFEFEEHVFGGASIDAHGVALTDDTLAACSAADAVLLAAVGGPKWDTTDPDKPRPEQGLLGLRKGLGLYANLRPVKPHPRAVRRLALAARADRGHRPARRARAHRRDLLRREDPHRRRPPSDVCSYTTEEIERIARTPSGRGRARDGGSSVDKANVLETSRLWREVVVGLHEREFPTIELEHVLVDNAAMQLVSAPRHVRRDPHGEHVRRHPLRRGRHDHRLDRHAPERVARAATAPACSSRCTAPRPTSRAPGVANPLAMFLSAAMLLQHGLGLASEAAAVESAVQSALAGGLRTPDLGGDAGTAQATRAVLDNLE